MGASQTAGSTPQVRTLERHVSAWDVANWAQDDVGVCENYAETLRNQSHASCSQIAWQFGWLLPWLHGPLVLCLTIESWLQRKHHSPYGGESRTEWNSDSYITQCDYIGWSSGHRTASGYAKRMRKLRARYAKMWAVPLQHRSRLANACDVFVSPDPPKINMSIGPPKLNISLPPAHQKSLFYAPGPPKYESSMLERKYEDFLPPEWKKFNILSLVE